MKIEVNIDIEKIVREEVRKYLQENLVINNVTSSDVVVSDRDTSAGSRRGAQMQILSSPNELNTPPENASASKTTYATGIQWEFAPKLGKRRSKAEIALHNKELELGRLLTPEEKGEAEAHVEINNEKQTKAKETVKNQARINEMAEEATAAATKELEEETKQSSIVDSPFTAAEVQADVEAKVEENSGIPKTENLHELDSLFS